MTLGKLPLQHFFNFPEEDEREWKLCKVAEDLVYDVWHGAAYHLTSGMKSLEVIDLGPST